MSLLPAAGSVTFGSSMVPARSAICCGVCPVSAGKVGNMRPKEDAGPLAWPRNRGASEARNGVWVVAWRTAAVMSGLGGSAANAGVAATRDAAAMTEAAARSRCRMVSLALPWVAE